MKKDCPPWPELSRRECLNWLARASLYTVAIRGVFGEALAGDKASNGMVKIGNLAAVRNESAKAIENPEVILTRCREGVACLSAYCTHKRNKLEVNEDGVIVCPVHASTFDLDGRPSGGPASKPLKWYAVQVDANGDIRVDVSSSARQGQWCELPAWAKEKQAPAQPKAR